VARRKVAKATLRRSQVPRRRVEDGILLGEARGPGTGFGFGVGTLILPRRSKDWAGKTGRDRCLFGSRRLGGRVSKAVRTGTG
jgi:hypothetical protein